MSNEIGKPRELEKVLCHYDCHNLHSRHSRMRNDITLIDEHRCAYRGQKTMSTAAFHSPVLPA